ncbi:Aminopeptidase N [Pseudomonas syringae pv. actinidiae]|uniref:Aminopeptidase N n=1 Tax=Pseudomonas syringae pv. actinidiae TaxID=103796 RepID=A0AAN4QCH3_PSESF|nr:Aminopeptidase N [Pseudomonas syringae pv. actinidiae]
MKGLNCTISRNVLDHFFKRLQVRRVVYQHFWVAPGVIQMRYPLHDAVHITRWQGFHMLDGDSEPLYKPRLGAELPFIYAATHSGLAGALVGHADQPLTLECPGLRFRWKP